MFNYDHLTLKVFPSPGRSLFDFQGKKSVGVDNVAAIGVTQIKSPRFVLLLSFFFH